MEKVRGLQVAGLVETINPGLCRTQSANRAGWCLGLSAGGLVSEDRFLRHTGNSPTLRMRTELPAARPVHSNTTG